MVDLALTFLAVFPVNIILNCVVLFLPGPAAEVIGIWFCHVASVFKFVWVFKIWVFSLLMSLLRYVYVVHNEKIKGYGLARVERIFRILYWAVPAGLMILHLSLRKNHDPRPWINRCYGWSPELPSSVNWWYKAKQKFCVYNDYGFANPFAEYGLRILCGVNFGATFLLFSNLAEAFIYYSIHTHLST